jgi:hypothetical protein
MRNWTLALLGLTAAAVLASTGCGGGAQHAPPPVPAETQQPATGAQPPGTPPEAAPAQVPAETQAPLTPTPSAPKPKPKPKPAAEAEAPREEPMPVQTVVVTLPAGTSVDLTMVDSIGSKTSKVGDVFHARVERDVVHEGSVVIPAGSTVTGVVTEAVPLGKIGGTAKLSIEFTGTVTPSGDTLSVHGVFAQKGKSESGKDAATIGGGAAAGAILGRALSKDNKAKGTVLGALVGAAAGGAVASKTKGEEIEIPAGTAFTLQTDQPVEVHIRR